ncbi:MAG: hypothetical protein WC197_05150 [Candidatus Gastranaerophilaceae bacterium]|jgi:hypothetical protein
MNIFLNPGIILVLFIFFTFIGILVHKLKIINKELLNLILILSAYSKNNLLYRFQELNQAMSENKFVCDYWNEFKNTLIFGDKIAFKDKNDFSFDSISKETASVCCISDSSYYFNEETLIYRILNHKLISAIPGILTGLGPLGTFSYIAIGFSGVNFSSDESTVKSITHLLNNMEIAAVISIVAISSALLFIVIERILYYFMCHKPLSNVQIELNKLFEKISTERFLIELVQETRKQNGILNSYTNKFAENIKDSMDKSIQSNIVPYLENIIFGLNQQKDALSKDIVDKLLEH